MIARLVSLAAAVALCSCATTTTIVTDAPGAKVSDADGKELGVTPYKYESKAWIWEKTPVKVSAGGKEKTVELARNEFDVLPGVGGICLTLTGGLACVGIPLFLAGGMKMPETTKVDMSDAKSKQSLAPSTSPQTVAAHYVDVVSADRKDAAQVY